MVSPGLEVSAVPRSRPVPALFGSMKMYAWPAVAKDPLVSASTGNYRMASNSPARTDGVDVRDLAGDSFTTDVVARGAYVTGDEIVGPVPIEHPPRPPAAPEIDRRRQHGEPAD